jgi:hypothetical protein
MPDDPAPPMWMKHALVITLLVSILMLVVLLLYVPLSCGQMVYATSGEYICDLEIGWYFYTGAFVVLMLYSAYNLNRLFYGWNLR